MLIGLDHALISAGIQTQDAHTEILAPHQKRQLQGDGSAVNGRPEM